MQQKPWLDSADLTLVMLEARVLVDRYMVVPQDFMTAKQNIWFCRLSGGKIKTMDAFAGTNLCSRPHNSTFVTGVTRVAKLPALRHQCSVAACKIPASAWRQEKKTSRTSLCSSTGIHYRIWSVQIHTHQYVKQLVSILLSSFVFLPLVSGHTLVWRRLGPAPLLTEPTSLTSESLKEYRGWEHQQGKCSLGVQKGRDEVLGSVPYAFLMPFSQQQWSTVGRHTEIESQIILPPTLLLAKPWIFFYGGWILLGEMQEGCCHEWCSGDEDALSKLQLWMLPV